MGKTDGKLRRSAGLGPALAVRIATYVLGVSFGSGILKLFTKDYLHQQRRKCQSD
jgi:hypothetical protein